MAYPPGAQTRVVFEGARTTVRTEKMTKEARLLFRLRGGGAPPGISQGGWSGGVKASAGTHGQDAMDDKIRLMSSARRKLWQRCNWEVGFAGWIRTLIAGLWPMHFHKLPKGGLLAPSADRQISQWHRGLNALVSNRTYPGILSSGFVNRTWESYLDHRPHGTVDLSGLAAAFTAGKPTTVTQNAGDNDVQQVQRALNHFLDSKLLVDGAPGPATKGVYATFQARLYGVPRWSHDANGIPGRDSLSKLGFTIAS